MTQREELVARWPSIRALLEQRLGLGRTRAWLGQVGVESVEGSTVVLRVTDAAPARLAKKYLDRVAEAIETETGQAPELRLEVGPLAFEKTAPDSPPREPVRAEYRRTLPERRRTPSRPARRGSELLRRPESGDWLRNDDSRLGEDAALSRFVPGPNRLPHRFARAVVKEPGREYSPLVLTGPAGRGKSHLLRGIALAYKTRYPDRAWLLCTAEEFSMAFWQARKRDQLDGFRSRLRGLDLLVLDDIHEFETKKHSQRELLHTIDALLTRGCQVVVGSAEPIVRLTIRPALKTRLQSGINVELQPLDLEDRLELLRSRARRSGIQIEDEVLADVARAFPENTHELLAAMTRLVARTRVVGGPLDRRSARRALGEMFPERELKADPETVGRVVAELAGLHESAVFGAGRKPAVVRARQLAMVLSRLLTEATLKEVGRQFGGLSTGAVHFARRRIHERLAEEEDLRELALAVLRRFESEDRLDDLIQGV